MLINTYVAGPVQANNYLVVDEVSKEAILIDCSDYVEEIIDYVKKNNLKVKYILLTHGHFDHVLGINRMNEVLGAKVYVHEGDKEQVVNTRSVMTMFGLPTEGVENPKITATLSDAGELTLGNQVIKVIETPGHTPGGVCYLIGDCLFSGDTLFHGTIGRTDLPGGSFQQIKHSVKDVLFALDENIKVYPGHGEPTSIGYEKKFNDIVNY